MKVLSVRQPWATLIIRGWKNVENRSKGTAHRGTLLIHASLRLDDDPYTLAWIKQRLTPERFHWIEDGLDDLPRGMILGSVRLHAVRTDSPSRWAVTGSQHWELRTPERWLRPVPAVGHLGLWDWDGRGRAQAVAPASTLP